MKTLLFCALFLISSLAFAQKGGEVTFGEPGVIAEDLPTIPKDGGGSPVVIDGPSRSGPMNRTATVSQVAVARNNAHLVKGVTPKTLNLGKCKYVGGVATSGCIANEAIHTPLSEGGGIDEGMIPKK